MAKLDAHWCLIRDTVVALKAPEDVIAEFITRSHIVVPRYTIAVKVEDTVDKFDVYSRTMYL
jgi:hypothetical protein